jgi:UDP-GlcNAc:undecaprenyl-phosphate/decaprenyl-phosphate GlcNAc-1-phosphate transferase
MQQYLLPATFSFILTLVLVFAALRFFPKFGLLDRPHNYGLIRKPIPYYGGLTIFLAFLISSLVFVKIDTALTYMLIGAVIIVLISFLDDMFGLSPWLRLFVQILVGFLLVLGGIGINVISNPLGDPIALDSVTLLIDGLYQISVLSALFTVLWVVGMMNTMNFLDGLNGLPSGVSAIAALTLFLLSIRPGIHFDISSQMPVAIMSIILFASCLAFWFFDFYPAKILMGDTGSMFLGYVIATLAIFSGGKIATAFLVMGFPILDAAWVILRRIFQGKSPMRGDRKHLHHRLLEIGLTERKALLLIYALCAGFGGIAVFLAGIQKVYAIGVLLIFMVILGFIAVKLSNKRTHG